MFTLPSDPTTARNARLDVVPTCVGPPEGGGASHPTGASGLPHDLKLVHAVTLQRHLEAQRRA
jgi:hypothetical protein